MDDPPPPAESAPSAPEPSALADLCLSAHDIFPAPIRQHLETLSAARDAAAKEHKLAANRLKCARDRDAERSTVASRVAVHIVGLDVVRWSNIRARRHAYFVEAVEAHAEFVADEQDRKALLCSYCQEKYPNAIRVGCGHAFHRACLAKDSWLRPDAQDRCPNCNKIDARVADAWEFTSRIAPLLSGA